MSKHLYMTFIAVLAVGLALLVFYSLSVFSGRTNAAQKEVIVEQELIEVDGSVEQIVPAVDSPTEVSERPSNVITDTQEPVVISPGPSKKSTYHVTRENCENECSDFDENTPALRYCEQICGIIPTKISDVDCESKDGLSRDYCLKDRAVSRNTPADCDRVADKGIWDQCRKQIIENTVDGF
jgi:hypothetical protein